MTLRAIPLCVLVAAACGGRAATSPAKPEPVLEGDTRGSARRAGDESPAAAPTERPVIELEPLRVEVVSDDEGGETWVAFDARSLFDEGNEALVSGEHDRALARYDQLVADFPSSKLVAPSLFNAGLALEAKGDYDGAVARYLEVVRREPTGRDSVDAHMRAAAVMADRERWRDSLDILEDVVARSDLSNSDRLEALTRRGYALLEAADLTAAEAALEEAIAYYDNVRADGVAHFETDYFIAMAHYYLGEIPRRQFAAIPIRLPDEQLARDVEAKAELVLLAHERYSATIEIGNIYWATAAGYSLASMQQDFWTALVTTPIPPQLDEDAATIYVEEVHKQALSLLEKALSIHAKNVELAQVYSTQTPWSEASKREVAELTATVARERAGDLVSPSAVAESEAVPKLDAAYAPGRVDL